jgi:3-oxoacyl-[acyl-carrier protein] reductase
MFDFGGRFILVTGSTRGIGRATAEALLAAGATVGIHGRDPRAVHEYGERLPGNLRGRAVAVAADLDDPGNGARLVRDFIARTGRIDGLVNNAGGGRAVAFRGMTLDRWRATFRLNLEAALCASREAYVAMRATPGGGIVNVASLAAHGPGKWMGADYAASKAGLVSLTRSLAFEAARFNLRVNAVSPGFVETDLTSVLQPAQRAALGIPLGRFARPEEIASVILFLLSDQSGYITGQVLHADGGLWM